MATKVFNTGKFSEKVAALALYDGGLMAELYQNPVNKTKINRGAGLILKNYFESYIDERAARDPLSFHHVYEFDETGDRNARLFKYRLKNTGAGDVVLSYSFTNATNRNREGYAFPKKAEVMEAGEPVVIEAKKSKLLAFVYRKTGQFVRKSKVIVEQPGGKNVKNKFSDTFDTFMTGEAQFVLKRIRYYERIEQAMISRRVLYIPRINSGETKRSVIRARIDAAAVADAFGGRYA